MFSPARDQFATTAAVSAPRFESCTRLPVALMCADHERACVTIAGFHTSAGSPADARVAFKRLKKSASAVTGEPEYACAVVAPTATKDATNVSTASKRAVIRSGGRDRRSIDT